MDDLLQRVRHSILERRLFRRRESILVAVSGGADSMVLLRVLRVLAPEFGWRLVVAHFNHRLRGGKSNADERLVERTARKLEFKFIRSEANVQNYAIKRRLSIEAAARELRHAFLASAAARHGCRRIALAHHSDDQVELFFLRVLRGAGSEGLAGMKWINASPARPALKLVRPFLDQSKTSLLDFAKSHKISFREDESNSTLDILRNRIRNELLPLLKSKYQPAINIIALRNMEIIEAEAEFISQEARAWLEHPAETSFEQLALAVQRKCLQIQLHRLGFMADFDLVERLRRNPLKPCSAGTVHLARDSSGIVSRTNAEDHAFDYSQKRYEFRGRAGGLAFAGVKLTWQIRNRPSGTFRAPKPAPNHEYLDADRVGSQVVLRHWQPGDRFQPIGMTSGVKLQDLFANLKIPRTRRHELVVGVTADNELFWVEGLRLSELFKLDKRTRRELKWAWMRP